MSLCIMIIIIINRNDYALKKRGFIMHWTIIGGGIQGTAIAQKLLSSGLTTDLLTIIDPHETFCQRFNSYTNRIEMPYLRSPIVHHVHPQPFHLKQFAKQHQYTNAFYGHINDLN